MLRVVALRARAIQWMFGLLVLCGLALAAFAPRWAGAVLNPPPGGPILVITSPQSIFGAYYGEILRNEGLNEFAQADIGSVTAPTLNAYDVVILAPATLTATQVTMFTNWVNGGGNLIAMSPDAQLAPLLGLAPRIVDLVSTGKTLKENGLVEREVILQVTSRLVVNRAAFKTIPAVAALVERFRQIAAAPVSPRIPGAAG